MNKFYTHTQQLIDCSKCFKNDEHQLKDGWELNNNPAYWGHSNPETLVLGYSKGATQMDAVEKDNFNKIAFKGMRERLKELLVLLKIINWKVDDINSLFTADTEEKIGFASFIRCGISLDNKTSGALITKSFSKKNTEIQEVMKNCTEQFLVNNLPTSVKRVILLGSAKKYKELSMKHFKIFFSDFQKIDKDNFKANNILWTYVAHPSPANAWFKHWVKEYKKNEMV